MTDIGFYHLTRSTLADALARLLARTLDAGERALVLTGKPDGLPALDAALWESDAAPWLPHGTEADGDADLQPIWLSSSAGPPANGAKFLFLVDGADVPDPAAFARVFDMFDGIDDAAVAAARIRYARARADKHSLTYWQQGARGWEKQG